VIELGETSCPEAFNVPFRHRFAPMVIRFAPFRLVPAAIANVCPPIVIEPGASIVEAVKAETAPHTFTLVCSTPLATVRPIKRAAANRTRTRFMAPPRLSARSSLGGDLLDE
jgi:hypothetical protein